MANRRMLEYKKILKSISALFAALLVAQFAMVSSAKAAESVRLDSNENLFVVLAAINMCSYDADVNSPNNSPMRAELRRALGTIDIPVLPEMQAFYKKHRQYDATEDLSQYISLALSLTGAPDFAWRVRDVEVPPDALALQDFRPLLAQFYRQARMPAMWQQAQKRLDKEQERYHTPLLNTTSVINSYLRAPSGGYLGRNFRVWIDLLGAPNQVQTRNYAEDAFVAVTHACQPVSDSDATCTEPPKIFDIRHAFLHYQIDPLVIKWGLALDSKKSLIDFARGAQALDDRYKNDFVLLATESLIKAIEAKLDKRPDGAMVAARQGFILAPAFYDRLATYEAQPQGLRFYLPDMIDGIDPGKETKRLDTVKFDKSRPVSTIRTVKPAAPQLSPAAKLLAEADSLLKSRQMEESKKAYLKALDQRAEPGELAQAWYGLGKLAIFANQPETAFKLFEKAIITEPDDWTKAWANVYLARLSKAAKEIDAASKYYSAALAVKSETASDARVAAEKESAVLPKK